MELWLLLVPAYLIGSIPFSFLVSRWLGQVDIRTRGSGNVGATNVFRTVGTKCALVAVSADALKGVLAVGLGLITGSLPLACACGVAAVVGHCWPAFLNFRGGKGVATSAGVLLALVPKVVLGLVIVFIISVVILRIVSVSSIIAAIVNPVLVWVLYGSWPLLVMSLLLSAVVVYQHRSNIDRLRKGIEPRLGERDIAR